MSKITSIALNSDLTAYAYGNSNGTVGAVNVLEDGQKTTLFPDAELHTQSVQRVCFSPDDRFIGSAGRDGIFCVLNLHQNIVWRFSSHQAPVNDIALSGVNTAITGSNDFTARIWDILHGKQSHVLECPDAVNRVSMSPAGTTAGVAFGSKLILMDASDGRSLHEISVKNPLTQILHSLDGKKLAGGTDKGEVLVWDVSNAHDVGRIKRMHGFKHNSSITALNFSRDEEFLAAGDRNGTVMSYNFADGSLREIRLHGANPSKVLALGFNAVDNGRIYFEHS